MSLRQSPPTKALYPPLVVLTLLTSSLVSYFASLLWIRIKVLMVAFVSSGSFGQTLISSPNSGYFCKVLSKLMDKAGLLFSESSLFIRARL